MNARPSDDTLIDRSNYRKTLGTARDDFGVGHILTWFNAGGQVPNDQLQRSMRLWMDEVAPAFAE